MVRVEAVYEARNLCVVRISGPMGLMYCGKVIACPPNRQADVGLNGMWYPDGNAAAPYVESPWDLLREILP